ncbi:MAG: HAD-IIIA family hydrolase [Desulfobacterales bacterium]
MSSDSSVKLKQIELLILDVDGVLTDGSIVYSDSGEELKTFNAKDGLGLRLLQDAGIMVSIVTGRRSEALAHRCTNLGISLLYQGVDDKAAALSTILKQTGVTADNTAAMGDDLPDLALLKHIGCAIAVADADEIVRNHADLVTVAKGGAGAVREVCEGILKAQGHWETILEKWL